MNIFYHNLTKEIVNETEKLDFMDNYDNGDIIYKSEAGNAILLKIEGDELQSLKEDYQIALEDEEG